MKLSLLPIRKLARLLWILAVTTTAGLAQGTGAIRGAVTTAAPDGVSVYLPNMQISLRCERIPANARDSVTDETGRFSLLGLAPDQCSVTASGEGFRPETMSAEIKENASLELSFQLGLMTVEEKVTVSGDAPSVETTDTSPKEEIKSSTLEQAPLATERVTDALPLLPGVVRGPDGLLNIKGARASQSGLLVNSANVTDPVTGEFGFNLPVDVVQSVQVLANPYDAGYGKFTGAVTTVQTRSGGDKLKFTFQNFLPRPRNRAGDIVGIEGFTPRLTVGGPIKKGKAYFLQSFEYRFIRTRVPGLRHLDRELRSDTNLESFDSHSQLDVDLNSSNHLSVGFSLFPQKLGFVNLNTFNPQEAVPNFRQRGFLLGINERRILANQSLLESYFSIKDFDADVLPSNPAPVMILAPEQNGGSFFNRQGRQSRRYEWQEVYRFRPVVHFGQHLVSTGLTISHSNVHGVNTSHPIEVLRSDSTLAQLIEFDGAPGFRRESTEEAFFVQDKWNPLQRITFDLGLRYDRDTLAEDSNIAPRVGVAIALTGDNRTVLRGGAGLFYDKVPLNVAAFTQFQTRRVTRFGADGTTELGPPLNFSNMLLNNNVKNPRSVAWNAELDREIARSLLIRLGYQQRQSRHDFVLDPVESPSPVLLLSSTGRSLYREFEVTTKYQVNEHSHVVASYVRSRSTGDLNDFNSFFGNFENPIIRPNERSLLAFDAPDRFLTWAEL